MNAELSDPAAQSQCTTVYGVLLNERATLQRMDAAFHEAPYRAPPKAPVLYLKPRNTHAADGAMVRIPAVPGEVQINATIGLVLGRPATRAPTMRSATWPATWSPAIFACPMPASTARQSASAAATASCRWAHWCAWPPGSTRSRPKQ